MMALFALTLGSCANSVVTTSEGIKLNIPNHQCDKSVRTPIPGTNLKPNQTKKLLASFKKNEDHNIQSIRCRDQYHTELKRIYNQ